MDVVTLALALKKAKGYTDTAISQLPKGVIYKGAVDYYNDLPTTDVEVGDCYTVKYKGTSGTDPDGSEYVYGPDGGTNTWIKLGSEDELFRCTYGTTTYQEISDAIAAGHLPVCIYNNAEYVYVGLSATSRHTFASQLFDSNRYVSVSNTNSWSSGANNFEIISNKATSISSSSTDTQYSSAAAVYNFVNEGVPYLTTAPTEDNTSGKLKVVVLDSEPATKYDGYLYMITEAPPPPTYTLNLYGLAWGDGRSTGYEEVTYIAVNRVPQDITTDYDYRTALTMSENSAEYGDEFGQDLYKADGTKVTQPFIIENVTSFTIGTTGECPDYALVVNYSGDAIMEMGWAAYNELDPSPTQWWPSSEYTTITPTEDMDVTLIGAT